MRLSKTAWYILGSGFFIFALIMLLVFNSQQAGEQERVEESLSTSQALLPQLVAEREDLENQLSSLESQLSEVTLSLSRSQAKFPDEVESIEYDEELFMSAQDCNLEIISITASEPYNRLVEDIITYSVTNFEIEVRGKVADMLAFIDIITTGGYFDSATVEMVDMKIPEPDKKEEPTATIRLTIYSYEGE
jgi:cell division protein FtsB